MDVVRVIHGRRSVGRLKGSVGREAITELIEAAIHAPNHHLTQPWRFTVVQGDARIRLGEVWGKQAAMHAGLDGDDAVKFAQGESAKTRRAPVLIVVSVRTDADPIVAEEDALAGAAAIQNMLLVAHARGLGAIWRTGKMVRDAEVKNFLGLTPGDRILGVVYLGEPDSAPKEKPEPNLANALVWFE